VDVLIDEIGADGSVVGRAAHQGPEVDGTTTLIGAPEDITRGAMVSATVIGVEGVDLIAEVGLR
jgi:hypothetical protein